MLLSWLCLLEEEAPEASPCHRCNPAAEDLYAPDHRPVSCATRPIPILPSSAAIPILPSRSAIPCCYCSRSAFGPIHIAASLLPIMIENTGLCAMVYFHTCINVGINVFVLSSLYYSAFKRSARGLGKGARDLHTDTETIAAMNPEPAGMHRSKCTGT